MYAADQLYDALSNQRFSASDAAKHTQAKYLAGYLDDISAATMVVEYDYVDADYLADFASFYVSCFEPYDRFCKRLHFFRHHFDAAHFERVILGRGEPGDTERLRDSYLGFAVVRPLPLAVVGRTALHTYPDDNGRRNYKALAPYRVSLYGIRLEVQSLGFQEQDTVLAACATVAIWSALQKTFDLFGTRAPRPPAITSDATRTLIYQRALPSTGLRFEQMMSAIRAADLEPEVYEPVTSNFVRPFASLIYAYCRAGLPVILVADIEDIGGHAITIAGYSLHTDRRVTEHELPATTPELLPLRGRRIDEFYAHDDAAGPFSRLVIHRPDPAATDPDDVAWHTRFKTKQWAFPDGSSRTLLPTAAIVPIYHKVRLRYDDVLGWASRVHSILASAAKAANANETEWDIYLIQTNDYKNDVRNLAVHERRAFGLMTTSQPHFIWRMTFSTRDRPIAEFLLDATSFSKAFPVFAVNWFDADAADVTKRLIETGRLNTLLTQPFATLLLREIAQRESAVIGTSTESIP